MATGNEDKQKPDTADVHAEPDHKSEQPRIRPRDNIDRSPISVVRRRRSA